MCVSSDGKYALLAKAQNNGGVVVRVRSAAIDQEETKAAPTGARVEMRFGPEATRQSLSWRHSKRCNTDKRRRASCLDQVSARTVLVVVEALAYSMGVRLRCGQSQSD